MCVSSLPGKMQYQSTHLNAIPLPVKVSFLTAYKNSFTNLEVATIFGIIDCFKTIEDTHSMRLWKKNTNSYARFGDKSSDFVPSKQSTPAKNKNVMERN